MDNEPKNKKPVAPKKAPAVEPEPSVEPVSLFAHKPADQSVSKFIEEKYGREIVLTFSSIRYFVEEWYDESGKHHKKDFDDEEALELAIQKSGAVKNGK
jgi:hypothetical protein